MAIKGYAETSTGTSAPTVGGAKPRLTEEDKRVQKIHAEYTRALEKANKEQLEFFRKFSTTGDASVKSMQNLVKTIDKLSGSYAHVSHSLRSVKSISAGDPLRRILQDPVKSMFEALKTDLKDEIHSQTIKRKPFRMSSYGISPQYKGVFKQVEVPEQEQFIAKKEKERAQQAKSFQIINKLQQGEQSSRDRFEKVLGKARLDVINTEIKKKEREQALEKSFDERRANTRINLENRVAKLREKFSKQEAEAANKAFKDSEFYKFSQIRAKVAQQGLRRPGGMWAQYLGGLAGWSPTKGVGAAEYLSKKGIDPFAMEEAAGGGVGGGRGGAMGAFGKMSSGRMRGIARAIGGPALAGYAVSKLIKTGMAHVKTGEDWLINAWRSAEQVAQPGLPAADLYNRYANPASPYHDPAVINALERAGIPEADLPKMFGAYRVAGGMGPSLIRAANASRSETLGFRDATQWARFQSHITELGYGAQTGNVMRSLNYAVNMGSANDIAKETISNAVEGTISNLSSRQLLNDPAALAANIGNIMGTTTLPSLRTEEGLNRVYGNIQAATSDIGNNPYLFTMMARGYSQAKGKTSVDKWQDLLGNMKGTNLQMLKDISNAPLYMQEQIIGTEMMADPEKWAPAVRKMLEPGVVARYGAAAPEVGALIESKIFKASPADMDYYKYVWGLGTTPTKLKPTGAADRGAPTLVTPSDVSDVLWAKSIERVTEKMLGTLDSSFSPAIQKLSRSISSVADDIIDATARLGGGIKGKRPSTK